MTLIEELRAAATGDNSDYYVCRLLMIAADELEKAQVRTLATTWVKKPSANDRQEGGEHYKKYEVQPWDVFIPWNLNGFQAHIIPYVVRYRDKDGVKDLKKARHFLDKLIELEEAATPVAER